MLSSEADAFKSELGDLCAAFDKPLTPERLRAFWNVLRPFPFDQIKARIRIAQGWERMPAPSAIAPKLDEQARKPNSPDTRSIIVDHVKRNCSLTQSQLLGPWNWIVRWHPGTNLKGERVEKFAPEYLGVVIDADSNHRGWRITLEDIAQEMPS